MKNSRVVLWMALTVFIYSCDKNETIIETDAEVEERQQRFDDFQLITPCEASDLLFFIDPECVGTPYAQAILLAIVEYNEAPISVFFTQTLVLNEAHLVFNCQEMPDRLCGSGQANVPGEDENLEGMAPATETIFPSGGVIGAEVFLWINWNNCPCTDVGCNNVGFEPLCMFQKTVMHEIGHVLGIAHNDYNQGALIPGTPDVDDDPNSIFNSGPITFNNCDWCDSPCVFNQNDLTALQFLYPCECPPDAQITGNAFYCENQSGQYCMQGQVDNITWTAPAVIQGQTTTCVTIPYDQNADNVFISANVMSRGCTYTLSRTIFMGAPDYPDISVIFDPCYSLIHLFDNANQPQSYVGWTFQWSISGLPNVGLIDQKNPGEVRVLYGPGQTFCVQLTVTNPCGTISTVGEPLCFITPGCPQGGGTIVGNPINDCDNNSDCPSGYECVHGVCNPIAECVTTGDCPEGYMCVNGECVEMPNDGCQTNADCPPGHRCKNGVCIPF